MIRLQKGNKPKVLKENAEDWTRELLDAIRQESQNLEQIRGRYKNPEIKQSLEAETSKKCSYCESFIAHVGFSHIEHYRPKRRYPHLTFDWENLLLSCGPCNSRKGKRFDEEVPIVHPGKEEPSDYLHAVGGIIWWKPGSSRGKNTESTLGLNRTDLVLARERRMERIRDLLDLVAREAGRLKEIYWEEIEREIQDDKEYVFVCRALLESMVDK